VNSLFDLTSPAVGHASITPHDTDLLSPRPRSIRVLTDGDLELQLAVDGETITYPVFAGEILPVQPIRVKTGTTASVVSWF
jgi:hypothetical protein